MQIEQIRDTLKTNFVCNESGLDWQEDKYQFEKDPSKVVDFQVNGITIPNVFSSFLNNDELLVFGKGDAVFAEIPREIIETFEVIEK